MKFFIVSIAALFSMTAAYAGTTCPDGTSDRDIPNVLIAEVNASRMMFVLSKSGSYWIIPYFDSENPNDPEAVTGGTIISACTGELGERAMEMPKGIHYLSQEKAVAIALASLNLPADTPIQEAVRNFAPALGNYSRFFPLWKITVNAQTIVYVTNTGKVEDPKKQRRLGG